MSPEESSKSSIKMQLQDFLAFRGHTKDDQSLQEILAELPSDRISEIMELVDTVPKSEVAQYMAQTFKDIDKYPQPADTAISRGELIDQISHLASAREQAIVLIVWFSFERIKNCVPAEPADAAFDYQFTRKDLEAWSAL